MDQMENVLKAPPDSTNSDLMNPGQEPGDNDSGSAVQSNTSVSTSPSMSKSIPFRDPYLPEDDGSILTPEHAFVQYQTRSEDQACQICGQPAVGFHHRAYVCEACKKFFMRHTTARFRNAEAGGPTPVDSVCPMGGQCRIEGPGRGKCPHCRYRKCLDLGMTLTPPGGESGCDISQIPCRVCGGPSSGFHFGALTCEGCKGFFRRTVLSNVRLECLSNNDCPITPANRNMCKSCRFQRCLAVGMSKTGSRIGRQPNAIKYYCAREISQLNSSADSDGAPTSSVLVANGRGQGTRQRTVSTSSDGDRGRSPAQQPSRLSSSSCNSGSVQPAHSSTDQMSNSHSRGVGGQQFSPSVKAPSNSIGLAKRGDTKSQFPNSAGLSTESVTPDSSPKLVPTPTKRRKGLSFTQNPAGTINSPMGANNQRSTNQQPPSFAHCEQDSERLKYASSPSLPVRGSDGIPREWYSALNQPSPSDQSPDSNLMALKSSGSPLADLAVNNSSRIRTNSRQSPHSTVTFADSQQQIRLQKQSLSSASPLQQQGLGITSVYVSSGNSVRVSAPTSHHSYPLAPSCKPSSPDNSWTPKQRYMKSSRSPLNDGQFRSIGLNNNGNSNSNNGIGGSNTNGTKYEPGSLSLNCNGSSVPADVTCTSSAPWFAAAAAAAAVANAIMVATQPPVSTTNVLADPYTVSSSVNTAVGGEVTPDQLDLIAFRRTLPVSTLCTKRLKMDPADIAVTAGSPTDPVSHELDFCGLNVANLNKCNTSSVLRSLHLPTSGIDVQSSSLTHPSTVAAMRAAAAAAAAAAATAAGLVLSNSRVRGLPEDFSSIHRSTVLPAAFPDVSSYSSGTSSPSPPIGTFARTNVISTVTDAAAAYAARARSLSADYFSSLGSVITTSSILPSSSAAVSLPSKEIVPRPKNGVRAIFVTVKDFADGISVAAKYMMSERKNIRNNVTQPCLPMQSLERVEDVWDRMMQHFELHSRFIVHFVKHIPGFNHLELSDKRQLVRNAMYPLMMLELSRDYVNGEQSHYNYFDFTESEREVILKHFPTFRTITEHLIRSGEFLDRIRLDNIELALVCAQEVFKNQQGLIDPVAVEHLYCLASRVLAEHIVSTGHVLEERATLLRGLSPLLDEYNLEHHQVIAQVRHDKPQLEFPELYIEMFQLTEAEQYEQEMAQSQQQQSSEANG